MSLLMAAKATLLLLHGNVVTLDPSRPHAQAIAIAGDRILAVGDDSEMAALAARGAETIDLQGATVVPGLTDAHCHVHSLGAERAELDLIGDTTYELVVKKVARRVARAKPGEWIRGRGWDQNRWEGAAFPEHGPLSTVAPENPVALTRVDGHALLVNARAMQQAGIDKGTADPAGGKILRDAEGEPTGVLIDNAMDLVLDKLPDERLEEAETALLAAQEEILAAGITGVHDMGIAPVWLDAYHSLLKQGKLKLRVYAALSTEPRYRAWLEERLKAGPEMGDLLTVRAIKLFADGALGSRGAALLADYSDDPGNRGLTLLDAEQIAAFSAKALAAGFQVTTHAIGDAGNRATLDGYQKALGGRTDARLRIEHAQVVALADIPRFKALGVVASMQPTHATSDMPWAESRVGPERIKGAYAWRKMLGAGVPLAFGSDFPVERVSALEGIYAAVTRQDREGHPKGGWHPEERLTATEALAAFTSGAAWASFREKDLGAIAPGKLADLTVLSQDITAVDPSRILETRVLRTVVAGKVVFAAKVK